MSIPMHVPDRISNARRQQASVADAALLAERRRQAALRSVGPPESVGAPAATPTQMRPVEESLFEARSSVLGGDIDDAGTRLVVLEDRVELRDGRGRIQGELPISAISEVAIRRRLSTATVTLRSADGVTLELKSVKPSVAGRLREMIAGLQLPLVGDREPSSPTAAALRRLEELAAIGLLSDKELAEKRAQLIRNGVGPRR